MRKHSGGVDSKYYYNKHKLENDIEAIQHEHKVFKDMIRHFILMDPSKMDLRYKDTLEVLMEIKTKYNL